MLVADGPVAVFPTAIVHRGHRAGKAALGRYLPDHVLPVPRPTSDMGQAEEVEAGPIRRRIACVVFPQRTDVDATCLVRVEREPKASMTLAQYRQDALAVDNVVERLNCVVGEADKGAIPSETQPRLVLEPFALHVVQEDVGRQSEITPPRVEPSVVRRRSPSSTAPAFSHLSVVLRMTPSVALRSTNVRTSECGIESKYLGISISSTQ